jgi:predicted nucleic acid-binding protein
MTQGEGPLPADASCLIHLARADAFSIATRCVDALIIAPAVWREAVEAGERLGYDDAAHIRIAAESRFVHRVQLDESQQAMAAAVAANFRLGQGESETIALGRARGRAILDDGRAARVAETLGVEPISTLFLPVLGRGRGLSIAEAHELLRRLAVVTSARAETIFEVERYLEEMP